MGNRFSMTCRISHMKVHRMWNCNHMKDEKWSKDTSWKNILKVIYLQRRCASSRARPPRALPTPAPPREMSPFRWEDGFASLVLKIWWSEQLSTSQLGLLLPYALLLPPLLVVCDRKNGRLNKKLQYWRKCLQETDAAGKFVVLENTHRGKEEPIGGWKLKRFDIL